MELRSQVSQSGVQVDVDAPKGQDLAQIMSEIRAKYEKMALKNQEELKAWHESQVNSYPLLPFQYIHSNLQANYNVILLVNSGFI